MVSFDTIIIYLILPIVNIASILHLFFLTFPPPSCPSKKFFLVKLQIATSRTLSPFVPIKHKRFHALTLYTHLSHIVQLLQFKLHPQYNLSSNNYTYGVILWFRFLSIFLHLYCTSNHMLCLSKLNSHNHSSKSFSFIFSY